MNFSEKIQDALEKASEMDMAVAELEPFGLSVKTIQALESKLGVIYLKELLKFSLKDLKKTKNLGPVAVKEIDTVLNYLPIYLLEKEHENSNFI